MWPQSGRRNCCEKNRQNGSFFSGDGIPQSGDMPIYKDVATLANSLVRLGQIELGPAP
jgi:hypothetical protein